MNQYQITVQENNNISSNIIDEKDVVINNISKIINKAISNGLSCSQNFLNQTKSFVDKQKLILFLERESFNLTEKTCVFLQPDDYLDRRFVKIYVNTI